MNATAQEHNNSPFTKVTIGEPKITEEALLREQNRPCDLLPECVRAYCATM